MLFAIVAFWALSLAAAAVRGFWLFGWIHVPWILIGLLVVFLWTRDRRHRRYGYRRRALDQGLQ